MSQRTFKYSADFDKKKSKVKSLDSSSYETVLSFDNYFLKKIAKLDYVKPTYLRKKLLEEFYPKLYLLKQKKKQLRINIALSIAHADNR